MGLTLTEKIIKAHIIDGEMVKGTEIGLKIDQTLTQDATGTMAYLQFEVPWLKSTVSGSHVPATESATRFILSALASPARPSSAPTATPPQAAVSACWQWAQADLT